ncbi:zinc finger protein 862-like [Mercenaria mercenaria]|uniref:zinc finger protein 862-like n=1 Tax=Mercenaria mercenaria TaxID=6596 RepID=UPI00234F49DA|nr:zinc finger protein 862-like [Mercenaria mercenaria]
MKDEYTDVSARKHLAVVGKYVYNGESNLSFLQDIQLPNGSADIIYQSLKNYLHDASISLDSMTSFASDGPSVMTGKKNGVVAKLKKDNPRVIPVHCLNHRLQLAVSKAFGSVREIDSVDEILIAIWKYYHFSTVKSGSLDAVQDLLREMGTSDTKQNLTVKKAVHTRWLSHENALHSIRKLYVAICQDLENAVVSGRDKKLGEKSGPSATGLLKIMKQCDKLFYMLLLCDMCTTLARLTLLFERADIDLASIQPQIQLAVANLQNMKKRPGPYLSKVTTMAETLGISVQGENKIYQVRDKFIDAVVDHMEEHLEHSELISAMSVLDLSHIPADQATFHGDTDISQLAQHLELSEDDLLFEWNDIKEKFSGVLDKCTPKFMLAKLFETKETTGSIFPLMTCLLSVHESLILSTAPVERVFSQVKLIVTDHRNRHEVETTNKLLMIKLNTKSASDIDMDKVIKKFLAKNRRLM